MASAKIATLVIRTLAKPISNQIKTQAKQHERFRSFCVNLAQGMYRAEVQLRTNLLGEPAKHVRPLSETRAIENGANALAEGFLFSVATALIIGETWRSSRSQSKRRDVVDEQLDDLQSKVQELTGRVDTMVAQNEERFNEERQRNDELTRILERVVDIGLRGGWTEFKDTPLSLPLIRLASSNRPQSPDAPSLEDSHSSSTFDSDSEPSKSD
ncbi:hypothetical protein EIP91_001398 [Steccherinum ochraceum]|uniref:OPA3-like protein n=1 Tax=Steccherinum ochraceum TaxID=92696 RepID=A0A4V2MWI6_9APHY|nr:hypothetical protein EIP91_001398 [Steccherinum ochraceum]